MNKRYDEVFCEVCKRRSYPFLSPKKGGCVCSVMFIEFPKKIEKLLYKFAKRLISFWPFLFVIGCFSIIVYACWTFAKIFI